MNDDQRLRDEVDDAELRELLRARPPMAELPFEVRARSRQRVRALAAVPAAAGLLMWVQHAALGAALGLVVVGATQAPRLLSRSAEDRAGRVATATPPRVKPPAPPRAEPGAGIARESTPQAAPPRVAAFSALPKADLDAELALLERARRELETQPAASLSALERHRTEFIGSTLWAEREILAISALVRLGRRVEAEGRAQSLRQRMPGSLYASRLDGILNAAP